MGGAKGKEWFRDELELRRFIAEHAKPWDQAATFLWNGKKPSIAMHGSLDWIAWLEDVAQQSGLSVGEVIEQALAEFSRGRGFQEPPSRYGQPSVLKPLPPLN